MRTINIGLVGLGTIGKGVFDGIIANASVIKERTDIDLVLKYVCDKDASLLEECGGEGIVQTDSYENILKDKEINIVVELIGGVHPAKEIISGALAGGKHVVTANKAVISSFFSELSSIAEKNKVLLNFEASVGGGIPIIRSMRDSFVANKIDTMYGILNGTTNFILSKMSREGCLFKDALAIAQEAGIAEKDPELDISGKDSAHKLAILSMLGFGIDVSAGDVYTEGIDNIEPQDIRNAREWGYSLKLLAIAKNTPDGVQLRVHPTMIPAGHLLSSVNDSDNAIFVRGDLVDESLLFGKGAGRKPTSSSVISDIVEISKYICGGAGNDYYPFNLKYFSSEKKIMKNEDLCVPFYLRFSVIDKPGVLAGISSILADNDISIAMVSQKERKAGETVPVVIMTHMAKEGNMTKAIKTIDAADFITDSTVAIRIEE